MNHLQNNHLVTLQNNLVTPGSGVNLQGNLPVVIKDPRRKDLRHLDISLLK